LEARSADVYNAALERPRRVWRRSGARGARPYATGQQYDTTVCEPPIREARTFDRKRRWAELQGDRFDAVLNDDQLHIWGDEAGRGKTTNAALAALDRDVDHAVYFDKHEKAREFVTDDLLEDADYHHQKGTEQKQKGHCMDVDHANKDCPEHGSATDCPSMCPIYDLEVDHEIREAYEALVPELGPNRAHRVLDFDDETEHPWHGDDCPWQASTTPSRPPATSPPSIPT